VRTVRKNRLLLHAGLMVLAWLVVWLVLRAIPIVALWLIARWRKDPWPEKLLLVAALAVIYAVVHFAGYSAEEKLNLSFVIFIVALLAPVIGRLTRERTK